MSLRKLNRMLEKSLAKSIAEKRAIAKAAGVHIFAGKTCVFCGMTWEQVKAITTPIKIDLWGSPVSAYPNCKGDKNGNTKRT